MSVTSGMGVCLWTIYVRDMLMCGSSFLTINKQVFQLCFHSAGQDVINCGTFHMDESTGWGLIF